MLGHITTQPDSSSANYVPYLEYTFQLTHDEAIEGIIQLGPGPDVTPEKPEPRQAQLPLAQPRIALVVINGEVHVVNAGAPPEGRPLPANAGILAGDS